MTIDRAAMGDPPVKVADRLLESVGRISDGVDAGQLIGVLDLKGGVAVHAVAGKRESYQPVVFPNGRPGCPLGLLSYFRSLGVQRFYVADLDSLTGQDVQTQAISRLIESVRDEDLFLDVGWSSAVSANVNRVLETWLNQLHRLRVVLATESMQSPDDIAIAAKCFGVSKLAVSFDVRGTEFVAKEGSVGDWIAKFELCRLETAIFLDVATVGTSQFESTLVMCDRMLTAFGQHRHQIRWLTGGAVRTAAQLCELGHRGCEGVLVATALLHKVDS